MKLDVLPTYDENRIQNDYKVSLRDQTKYNKNKLIQIKN